MFAIFLKFVVSTSILVFFSEFNTKCSNCCNKLHLRESFMLNDDTFENYQVLAERGSGVLPIFGGIYRLSRSEVARSRMAVPGGMLT